LQKPTINLRLAVICLAAASVGLSMAIVSISKLLLVVCGLVVLLFAGRKTDTVGSGDPQVANNGRGFATRLSGFWTPYVVMLSVFAFALSLLWTVAPEADALGSLAKYGKLITIVLMLGLIRSRREARLALASFVVAQIFLLASSWLLFFHVRVPWATSNMALLQFAVFSSYLDQGIMGAVLAALCWHLRSLAPGRFGPAVAIAIAAAAMANVLFVLSGRSGHVVAIALLSLAIMWELPRRFRLVAVAVPFVLVVVLFFSSTKVRERLMMVRTEVASYSTQVQPTTSSGIRLGLWRRAVQIIAENPVAGAGVGAWSTEYNRLQRSQNPAHVDIAGNGNPHQEYLLWGVQLGTPGLVLFCALLLASIKDALKMEQLPARALQSVVLALAVACAFNASIYDALIGDFFCVLLGLLLALGSPRLTSPRSNRLPA
jgi:O-antigen ligase